MSQLNSISLLETLFSPIKILQHVTCDNKSELGLVSSFLRCLLEDGNAHLEELIVVIYLSVAPRSPCSGWRPSASCSVCSWKEPALEEEPR